MKNISRKVPIFRFLEAGATTLKAGLTLLLKQPEALFAFPCVLAGAASKASS